jgi:hypothetical protein
MANEKDFTWERKDDKVCIEKRDGFELKYHNLYYHYQSKHLASSEPMKQYIEDDNYKAWKEHVKQDYFARMEQARMW